MYQTFKRKRAIADRGGAQAKYLEKVVAPDKSNSPSDVVAISPDPQNTPTLADSSPTTLVISDAPTQQTPTAANSMIMLVDIAPAQRVLEKRNQPLLVFTIQFAPRLFKRMKSCVFCQQKHMQ